MRISRYKLKDEVYKKLFTVLFEVIGKRSNKDEFIKVIEDLLSPVERIMIAKRVLIIYLLMKKIDYQTICDVLKVSNGTVSKFRLLMENSHVVVSILEKKLKEDRIVLFIDELMNDLFPPGTYGTSWSSAWKNKIDLQRRRDTGI